MCVKNNALKKIFVFSFILYCFLLPANYFKLKVLLWLIVTILYIQYVLNGAIKTRYRDVYLFSIIYPILTSIVSLSFGDGNYFDVFSLSWVWGMLLIVPICVEAKIDYLKIFLQGSFIVALVTDLVFLLDVLNVLNVFDNPLSYFLKKTGDMLLGKGELSTYGYFIFYKTAPLLIISLCYCSFKGRKCGQFLLFLALCVSGTRANFLSGVIALVVGNMYRYRKNNIFVILFCLLSMGILYFYVYDDYMYKSSLKSQSSDNVKISDILTIMDMMTRDKVSAILGWGIGSYFLTETRGWVNCIEVSFLDYARQIGVIFFMLFLYFILYPMYKLFIAKIWWLLVGYVLYIFIASTNPLLLTSTAFLGYILVYYELSNSSKYLELGVYET